MDRQGWVIVIALGLLLSMVARHQQRKLELDIHSYDDASPDEDDEVTVTAGRPAAPGEGGPAAAAAPPSSSGKQVSAKSREARLFELEKERQMLRAQELEPALNEAAQANMRAQQIRRSMPWFPSESEKATLAAAESSAQEARNRLALVQKREQAVVAQVKPLLGLVSAEFYHDQRSAIQGSLQTVSSIAYNNAWWSSLFNLGRAESLTDVFVEFFMQYALVYALAYPFAWAYYVFWVAPWSIYSYCESLLDLPTALLMWLMWVAVMSLPGIALYFGLKFLLQYARENAAARGRAFRPGPQRIF